MLRELASPFLHMNGRVLASIRSREQGDGKAVTLEADWQCSGLGILFD
jgi:hypothetical protein